MKARGWIIASAATVLGVGTVAHMTGHAPRCPLAPLFKKEAAVKKAEAPAPGQIVANTNLKTVAMNQVKQK